METGGKQRFMCAGTDAGRIPKRCGRLRTYLEKLSLLGCCKGRCNGGDTQERREVLNRRFWDARVTMLWACVRRCAANLRKTWWPRLNRGVRIGAITTLSLHLSVCKTLPLLGGIPGQDWCINTYSLASTSLPEQSGASVSCFWVWVFTLACIALITFILFPVLSFGAALGRSMCLLVFLVILSWLSVMRLPMTYKVSPFVTDVNTYSMTGFAYVYIPYTAAALILAQQHRAFDTDLYTGLKYIGDYSLGILTASLVGWALFALQVALPPWSSQRQNVRLELSRIMCDVRDNLSNISHVFGELRQCLLMKEGDDSEKSYEKLKATSQALQESCQSMYRAIGRQTSLRVAIVASSTEPYFMYPGPGVFLFPFFARCFEVLIHNCMTIITLSRNIHIICQDLVQVRVGGHDTLAEILHRTEPLLDTTVNAYTLCAALVLVRPSSFKRAAFQERIHSGLELLADIDKNVGETFNVLRSPSMQLTTRQQTICDDVSVCLRRLVSRASFCSNASAMSDQSAALSSFSVSMPNSFAEPLFASHAAPLHTGTTDHASQASGSLFVPQIVDYRAANASAGAVFRMDAPAAVNSGVSSQAFSSPMPASVPVSVTGKRCLRGSDATAGRRRSSSSSIYQSIPSPREHVNDAGLASEDDPHFNGTHRFAEAPQQGNGLPQTWETQRDETSSGRWREARLSFADQFVPGLPEPDLLLPEHDVTADVPYPDLQQVGLEDSGNAFISRHVKPSTSGSFRVNHSDVGRPSMSATSQKSYRSGNCSRRGAMSPSVLSSTSLADANAVLKDICGGGEGFDAGSEVGSHRSSSTPRSPDDHDDAACKLPEPETSKYSARVSDRKNEDILQKTAEANGDIGWPWLDERSPWTLARQTLDQPEYVDVSRTNRGLGEATEKLRQEMRLSKLIVSLYQICAFDTQELCSTVRGVCIAVMTPSWQGARQNLKMMTLSLGMVFVQLFVGLRGLMRPDKWKWKGNDAFYCNVEIVHCVKLIGGLGFLFGCCLFYGKQIDHFLGGLAVTQGPHTAKQWVILGFLCAHSFTYEGSTNKGLKRAVGTMLGGLAVELALVATTNYLAILAFVFVSITLAVFIFASPTDPASEYDREFGYIGQVFIWTITFVLSVIWTYEGTIPYPKLRDTVVRSRVTGNLVGIGFSVIISYVPPAFSAETCARTHCATLLKTCRRCTFLLNAAFLSLTQVPDPSESGNAESGATGCSLAYSKSTDSSFPCNPPSPITAPNRTFQWARFWKFGCRGKRLSKHEWHRRRRRQTKRTGLPEFHDFILQAEELLRHHSTRLLVVGRMLYEEGASSPHSPFWRVDPGVGEIMNKVEYLIMAVVDTVDNLCHLALTSDPGLALFLNGGQPEGGTSWLSVVQEDRRNWGVLLRCRSGKALQLNLFRMIKAQSRCFIWLAKEITAAMLNPVDRAISFDWCQFHATVPRKYLLAAQGYARARFRVERYNSRIYECLTLCGKELQEAGAFKMDEWKTAIFSVLLIVEKCDNRTYFMDELHRFQATSVYRTVYGENNPDAARQLVGSASFFDYLSSLGSGSVYQHQAARSHTLSHGRSSENSTLRYLEKTLASGRSVELPSQLQ
ncbi:hypothetical protein TGME49_269320 [Toxoplasma gondii ME49]|uniref:Integral membrane bound transporter domain-containing protein n=1 Tax=Toxoplasma gondii (strain ATCC 50611 / Me49) TaxID=508771 RepID=S8F4F6_TOXGM|nr:hypothetical protein TGME49_269320 [Toxoplasma gondii ME49]EPT28323.1 hypothetical protein TGME49_269320 [Toxoplasma gondii ME49]|eukprot:XP_018636578.1 hypothetical protein TGME49_269320 [Toxoplasma gondii ME49]